MINPRVRGSRKREKPPESRPGASVERSPAGRGSSGTGLPEIVADRSDREKEIEWPMARSRNIKPAFFANEDLGECQPVSRLLFVGLWCLADREGRMDDRPRRIKAQILPYDSVEIDPLLEELASYGLIVRYEIEGRRLIQIPAFGKHQNPHHREPASILPPPLGWSPPIPVGDPEEIQPIQIPPDEQAEAPVEKKIRKRVTVEENLPWSLWEAVCAAQGIDPAATTSAHRSRMLAVAKRMAISGMTVEEADRMARWLRSQDWITDPVDMHLIEKQHGKWIMAGKPEVAQGRSPRSGRDVSGSVNKLAAIARGGVE